MAVYRYQVTSVGYWRGQVKRWNTTFHSLSNGLTNNFKTAMMQTGYKGPGDVVGSCSGGVAEIKMYNAAGGAPISTVVYFDWKAPGTWIPYSGEAWSDVAAGTPVDAAGESAAVIIGNMAGTSVSGKPVTTRKFLHAVPSRESAIVTDPDIAAVTIAKLKAAFPLAYLANPRGQAPASVAVPAYYLSHQRVRGRRRTTRQVATQAFSMGVLAGGGATTSGAGERVPGGEF